MHNILAFLPNPIILITNQLAEFMKKLYSGVGTMMLILLTSFALHAQTSISGKITDAVSGDAIAGVNIVVKGRVVGTITNGEGAFSLNVNDAPPMTLVISFIGFRSQEIEITDASTTGLDIKLEEQTILGQEVVVSASRYEESILQSPVTVEKVDLLSIQQTPAPEFYESLASVKGVQMTSSSLNFPQINTRGFATIANTRFVQLIDGMDCSAPLLNFPTGNIVGFGELDAESMELVPGAASALYGPNAFNGILIMKSKSPFEYQGLSAQFKTGVTNSEAQGEANPMYNFGVRYAKAFNNKFAFKVNFSLLQATDWIGNDYKTDVNRPDSKIDLSGAEDFDGLNLYGDEIELPTGVPSIGTIHRTGWKEEDLLDNNDATSMKGDVALHYRITDKMELIGNYRYGGGSSIYQGSQKYALRDFTQQFYKLELKGSNFFVRSYLTATNAGDSYNVAALGAYMNENIMPSPTWAQQYVLAMQGYFVDQGVPAGNADAARGFADRTRPAVGTPEFRQLVDSVRTDYFQKNPKGAKFTDKSRLFHSEFNYNFADKIEWVELQIGGNFRQYSLFSDGTIFNEDPEDGTDFQRVTINEYGFYGQLSKTLADALKLTGSLRYDKNENFDGQVTPRLSAVYTFNESHNIRASFQTGFRNPDTQAQFIYFDLGTNTLLGSAKVNAERYGLHEGGAYTKASYDAFRASGGTLNADGSLSGGNQSLLVTANIPYVGPEKLKSFELGYKGLMNNRVLIDLNGYYSVYNDFIGGSDYVLKAPTEHQGQAVNAGKVYSPYTNSPEEVTSFGVGLGFGYNLPKGYQITGNYNYATFDDNSEGNVEFRAGFNTPENKFNIGFSNRKVTKSLGFSVNYRWQEEFLWQSDFGSAMIPEFGVFDAQVSYKIPSIKTMVKVGGTNLFGGDYRTNFGGPFVGQTYYLSLTFDQFMKP